MRLLKTSDIPAMCRCLKAIGVKEKIKNMAQNADDAKDVWGMGFDLLWDVFDAATEKKGEKSLYEFLAGPFEMPATEVEDLPIAELIENLKQIASDNNLNSFFKLATDLMK